MKAYSNPNNKPIKQFDSGGSYPEDYFTSRTMSTYEVEKIIEDNRERSNGSCVSVILSVVVFAIAFGEFLRMRDRIVKLEKINLENKLSISPN